MYAYSGMFLSECVYMCDYIYVSKLIYLCVCLSAIYFAKAVCVQAYEYEECAGVYTCRLDMNVHFCVCKWASTLVYGVSIWMRVWGFVCVNSGVSVYVCRWVM